MAALASDTSVPPWIYSEADDAPLKKWSDSKRESWAKEGSKLKEKYPTEEEVRLVRLSHGRQAGSQAVRQSGSQAVRQAVRQAVSQTASAHAQLSTADVDSSCPPSRATTRGAMPARAA